MYEILMHKILRDGRDTMLLTRNFVDLKKTK